MNRSSSDRQAVDHLCVYDARIGLTGDEVTLLAWPAHLLRYELVKLLDFFVITAKQLEERGLCAGRTFDAAEAQRSATMLDVVKGDGQIMGPECSSFADRGGLCRLKVRESQRG